MSVASWIRRSFKNGVSVSDSLANFMSAGDMAFVLEDGSSFPVGGDDPFIATISQGKQNEEKVLVQVRSGATCTVADGGRGYNGTTAASHPSGDFVLHTIDAQDLDEANATAAATLGQIANKGDLLSGSGPNALSPTTVGVDGTILTAQSRTPGGVEWLPLDLTQLETLFTADNEIIVGTGTATATVIDFLAQLEQYFTADNQVIASTGSGTGAVIDFLTQLEQYFSAKGQLIVGTGSATGAVLAAPGSDNLSLLSLASAGGGVVWGTPPLPATQYAQITANQTGITSLVAITGLSVTITVAAGQNLKLTAFTYLFTTAGGIPATDQYTVGIYEGSTLLNEVVVATGNGATVIARLSPSAGSHTYIVQANHVTGTNAGIFGAEATTPAFILAEITG